MAKRTKSSVNDPVDMGTTDKLALEVFLESCSTIYRSEVGGVKILKNPLFTRHLFLTEYARDIFDTSFLRIEVEVSKNEIRFWSKYGDKVVNEAGEPVRDKYGYMTFALGSPNMVIRGLLKE